MTRHDDGMQPSDVAERGSFGSGRLGRDVEAEGLPIAGPGWRARSFGALAALMVLWFALAFLGGLPVGPVEWLALALLGAFAYSVGLVIASLVTLVMHRSNRL